MGGTNLELIAFYFCFIRTLRNNSYQLLLNLCQRGWYWLKGKIRALMENMFVWSLHVWAVHLFSPSAYVDFINTAPEPLWLQGFQFQGFGLRKV